MSDLLAEYPHRIDAGESFKKTLQGEEVWKSPDVTVMVPDNPLIQSAEGTHLRVVSNADCTTGSKALRLWAVGLGLAKALVEGKSTKDMWVNLIMGEEWSGGRQTLDVFGRKPQGISWGETLPYPTEPEFDHGFQKTAELSPDSQEVKEQIDDLKKVWERYGRIFWLPRFQQMKLFPEGIHALSHQDEEFLSLRKKYLEREYPWEEEVVWANDKFTVVIVLHPHIKSGIHLVVHPREEIKRAWGDFYREVTEMKEKNVLEEKLAITEERTISDVEKALEGVAIASGVAHLLQKEAIVAHTSIRVTNSWSPDFQEEEFKARINEEGVTKRLKREKRKWRRTDFHPHIYGARKSDESIRTTRLPRHLGGEDWKDIVPLGEDERQRIQQTLTDCLEYWLMENCSGPVYSGEKNA